jgi:hypothetical protein
MTMPGKRRIALCAALVLLLALAGGAGAEALNPQGNPSRPDAEKLEALLTAWENTHLSDQWDAYWASQYPHAGLPQAGDIAREEAFRIAVHTALRMQLVSVDSLSSYTPNLGYYTGIDGRRSYWAVALNPRSGMTNEGVYQNVYIEVDAITGDCLYLLIGGNG